VTGSIPLLSHSSSWRYNQSGANLGAGWAATSHPVGGAWQSGQSPLGFSNNTLPLAIATPLVAPRLNNPYVVTTYFETDFMLNSAQAESLVSLGFTHLTDDGAVFYLNGVELTRFNMPAGTITAQTFSSAVIGNAALVGPLTVVVPPGIAVTGSNRLSVEVHQQSLTSSDIAFSLAATAMVVTAPGIPDVPASPSPQQWLELHNRGTAGVDLSGWQFTAGIAYVFPSGTVMEAGAIWSLPRTPRWSPPLRVPPCSARFPATFPARVKRLLLVDAFGNPADEVSYVDGGRWPSSPDGGGSTLELRDPRADNSLAESWAASDEGHRRSWQTITYQGVAAPARSGRTTNGAILSSACWMAVKSSSMTYPSRI
jgi:hypothetical protein